jgi:hypothetical protein
MGDAASSLEYMYARIMFTPEQRLWMCDKGVREVLQVAVESKNECTACSMMGLLVAPCKLMWTR